MESSDCKFKLKVLFQKLFHDKFELSAEQTENLVKNLDGNHDKSIAKFLETPYFGNLLLYALKKYEHATVSVKIFFAKLMRNVLSNEVLFNRFVHMQGFELFISYFEALQRDHKIQATTDAPEALYEAMVQAAFAMISHYSGIKFFVENKIYQRILKPDTHFRPPAIAVATYEVMAKLIWKLNEYEEETALQEVLQYVVNPFSALTTTGTAVKEENSAFGSESFVQTLIYILGEVEHLVVPNNVVQMLTQVFSIQSKLSTALLTTRDPTLARFLADASLRYYYAVSRQLALHSPESEAHINQEFHNCLNNILAILIQKRSYTAILEFHSHCHAFLHRVESVGSPIEFEKFSHKYLLQNQFVLALLNPIFTKLIVKKTRLVANPLLTKANNTFIDELYPLFPRDSIYLAYDTMFLTIESTGNHILPACTFALRELLRLKPLLRRPQACVVFQTLYYALSEFVLSDGSNLVLLANPLRTQDDERYLALLLAAIGMLLDDHQINWNESLEIVELQAALINLIKQNILPGKLLVQTVDLITTCVRNYLSPELALQMKSQRGGSLREVAAAARALLARPEPAVRVAALQLAHSFMEIAYVKFMPLRSVISAHGLLKGAAGCALREADARAQAAALRCLAAAARCEDLWTELLEQRRNLYEQLVSIMRYNIDGEVRKEATRVLSHVYAYCKVTDVFTRYVSKAMTSAANEDPHWPVRLAALGFWEIFINKQFTDRGAIDGAFPAVTFCKVKRKIIVLNDKEIHKQIEIAMQHLSMTGCLAVLLKCLDSNNNAEVIERSYSLTKRMVEGLDHYKYTGLSIAQTSHVNVDGQSKWLSTFTQHDDNDSLMDILEYIGSDSSSDTESPIEIVQPSTFIEIFREMEKKRPPKVDLLTLIDEIVAS